MRELNYTITPVKSPEGETAKILLQGELVLQYLDELKDKLLAVSEKYKDVEIMLRNVESIDLACLQMFYSLKQTLAVNGKKLHFDIELNSEVETILKHTGFDDLKQILNLV